jgi:mannose-6-phosphate isomerase-like protein (cupin superfamily)
MKSLEITKKVEEDDSLDGFALRIVGLWDTKLTNGAYVAPHSHEDIEEVYYILEGTGEITVNNEQREISKGDIIYVPPKAVHTVLNNGKKPLRLITFSVSLKDRALKRIKNYVS